MTIGNRENDLDVVRGADEIARAIGVPARRAYALLEKGVLPAWKELGIWTTTRERLREHYESKTHS